jgi:hypothetical protein
MKVQTLVVLVISEYSKTNLSASPTLAIVCSTFVLNSVSFIEPTAAAH